VKNADSTRLGSYSSVHNVIYVLVSDVREIDYDWWQVCEDGQIGISNDRKWKEIH